MIVLTSALTRCENCANLSRPKNQSLFSSELPSLNELIGYVDMMDFGEIWPACWSDI